MNQVALSWSGGMEMELNSVNFFTDFQNYKGGNVVS